MNTTTAGPRTVQEEANRLMILRGWDIDEYIDGVKTAHDDVLDQLERDLLLPPVEGEPAHIETQSRGALVVIANERRRRRGDPTVPWNGQPYPDPRA